MPPPTPLPAYLYKILTFTPTSPLPLKLTSTPLDKSDGYIHLSTATQTPHTAARFFGAETKLHLIKIDRAVLEEQGQGELKWEDTRSHGVFAHWYGEVVPGQAVVSAEVYEVGEEGWEVLLAGLKLQE